jgi:hypothetical protein
MLSNIFSVVLRPSILVGSGLQIYPLRDIEGVINLDSEMPDSAFQLRVTEEQLHRAQVSGLAIDLGDLCTPH